MVLKQHLTRRKTVPKHV